MPEESKRFVGFEIKKFGNDLCACFEISMNHGGGSEVYTADSLRKKVNAMTSYGRNMPIAERALERLNEEIENENASILTHD